MDVTEREKLLLEEILKLQEEIRELKAELYDAREMILDYESGT